MTASFARSLKDEAQGSDFSKLKKKSIGMIISFPCRPLHELLWAASWCVKLFKWMRCMLIEINMFSFWWDSKISRVSRRFFPGTKFVELITHIWLLWHVFSRWLHTRSRLRRGSCYRIDSKERHERDSGPQCQSHSSFAFVHWQFDRKLNIERSASSAELRERVQSDLYPTTVFCSISHD